MRKILLGLLTLVLSVVLIACNNDGVYAKVDLKNVETFADSISFDFELVDPDSQILAEMDIRITIFKTEGNTQVDETRVTKEDLKDKKDFAFRRLEPNTKYTIVVKTTIDNESVTLFSSDYETDEEKGQDIKTITTIEEFLQISKYPGDIYHLEADLDFTGKELDIANNRIATFTGEFHGNNHTIKNFAITSGSNYYGMFGTLASGAIVKDLILENPELRISSSGSTRVAGLLFGRISHTSAIVDNIKIYNGNLEMKLNSESLSHDVGLLGGRSIGTVKNIFIDDQTTMTIDAGRLREPKIGGLIGKVETNTAILENIDVNGSIDIKINQTKNSGLRDQAILMHVGGVVGRGWQLSASNIVSKTNINISEVNFYVEDLEDDQPTRHLRFRVGGLFGELGNTKLEEAIYAGNISFSDITYSNDDLEEDEVLTHRYQSVIEVGGFFGRFGMRAENLINILRASGNITITNTADILNESLLIGVAERYNPNDSYVFYHENNKFGYLGDITGSLLVREITDLKELFSEDSFVYTTYNK